MAKKSPFQVGTRVRIVTPERFVRCGYNLNPAIASKILVEKHEQDIIEFMKKLGIDGLAEPTFPDFTNTGRDQPVYRLKVDHRMVKRLLGDLGYFYTSAHNFGGRDRQIFTVPAPQYEGLIGVVTESRTVMTGTYYAPSGGYSSYDGEYDYETGGLEGMKSNRIHKLSVYRPDLHSGDLEYAQFGGLWFEQRCLEVVPE